MKRIACLFFASTLLLSPMRAMALSGGTDSSAKMIFPPLSEPFNGGSLGFAFENQVYVKGGMSMFKVMEIYENSPLRGVVHVGDYVYNVNGFYIRSGNDVVNIIRSGSPGTELTISYLDATDNFSAKGLKATLIAAPGVQVADSRPWCAQSNGQLAVCAIGAAIAVGVVASMLSGSQNGPSSDSNYSGNQSSEGSKEPSFKPYAEPQKPSDSKPVDNGVDCFWGYTSMGTCH